MKFFLTLINTTLLFLCLIRPVTVSAQISPDKLSSAVVSDLSDTQIKGIVNEAGNTGQDINTYLQSKGVTGSKLQQYLTRINSLNSTMGNDDVATGDGARKINYQPDTVNQKKATVSKRNDGIFGADLFNSSNTSFEPNLRVATPLNYILGPDDQLNVNVYGKSVISWHLVVSPEGNVNLPRIGMINVSGRALEQATKLIEQALIARNYAIGNGSTLSVTLGNIRSIKVILAGEVVKPGTYTLPSLATAFNALYLSGGPGENGSFRQIEIIRNNKIIRKLDIYDFLLKADQKDNISLQDQDIIRVPIYDVRVQVTGQVKRPGIFETLPGETLKDVLRFAGGYTDFAYTAKIKILQISDEERKITDLMESQFKTYTPIRGDQYIVSSILNRFRNKVSINGAVFRPGDYELVDGLTLTELIKKAAGLKEDAYLDRGYITRLKSNNTLEDVPFDLRAILAASAEDIFLRREDSVTISSLFDLRDQYTIKIKGQIRKPGDFPYSDRLTVESLIEKAGGFSEGASSNRIQVARIISNSDPMSLRSPLSQVYSVDVTDQLSVSKLNFLLKPFDVVSVFPLPGYQKVKSIVVEGEILYPGSYAIIKKNERISDVIAQAGGLVVTADPTGGTLKRTNAAILGIDKSKIDTIALERERVTRLRTLQKNINGSAILSEDQIRNDYVGIDLKKILDHPGSDADLPVEDGDLIRVPKQQVTVRVNGEVLYPSVIVYNSKSFKDYISGAGGYSSYALRGKAYVVYPNGTVRGTTKFLFFNHRPSIRPGSEIFVPRKIDKPGITLPEIIGIAGGLASFAVLMLGILNFTK